MFTIFFRGIVWFQRGQEVLELISISLDPDILIQENEQYVTIQGALELSGEYKRNEIEKEDEEDTFSAPKFIQVVEEREEGICEFHHFFPVDISIPTNRIDQIENIDVKVESFDYIFPERSCMKLTANLMITGLYGEQQRPQTYEYEYEEEEVEVEEEVEEIEVEEERVVEEDYHEVRVELKATEEENEEKEEIYLPFQAEAKKEPPKPNERVEPNQAEAKKESLKPDERVEPKEVKQAKEENQAEAVEIPVLVMREEASSPIDIFKMPKTESSSMQEAESSDMKHKEESSSSSVKVEEVFESEEEIIKQVEKKKTKSKKKSMSLTEFFARKEEAEVAKLKVCIVQSGDTVDMIAERYDIPVLQLLKVNHLEINHDIQEGQVLYIPAAVAR
ncbi:stage VI sporulation protein D [Bacillus sp. Bva_UNVM-123]|uniref:stage VI sporulation protein D n=1 Tax=Bacillus sp. Bva_UNVM-123 TaxID=2829798 RepID=UPI00391F6CB8